MQLLNKFNKRIRFLLCVIDIFSKYAWAVPLKDQNGVTIVNAFQQIVDDSKRKPNKICTSYRTAPSKYFPSFSNFAIYFRNL